MRLLVRPPATLQIGAALLAQVSRFGSLHLPWASAGEMELLFVDAQPASRSAAVGNKCRYILMPPELEVGVAPPPETEAIIQLGSGKLLNERMNFSIEIL